ncbi:MAG: glycosyltransferase family 4 protein [Patescibacteria group bacterium]
MKIGFISPHSFNLPGGVKRHVLSLKKEFEERGHVVKLILPRGTLSPSMLLTKFADKKEKSLGEKDNIFFGGSVRVPSNASKANLSLNISPLSIWRRIRKEKFDILHFQNFGMFLSLQVLEAADQLEDLPLKILTLHALWDASFIFREMPTLIDVFNKLILPRFDGVIGVSQPVLSQIEYKGPKEIIPNGIDLSVFKPKGGNVERFVNQGLNILFVGRLEKRKGLVYLVKAFEKLKQKFKDTKLIVVGTGEKEKEIKEYIEKHQISDVFFEGEVGEKDLPRYYRTADICCFPSIYGESFGLVLLEAMASAKPVVAFANQGYKEVLKGRGADFLVEPEDTGNLAKKMEILIINKKKRREMAGWGRKEAKKYSWSRIARETLEFYKKVLK